MNKKIILITILLLSSFLSFSHGNEDTSFDDENIVTYDEKALVLSVQEDIDDSLEGFDVQFVKVKILTGKYKGEIFDIENTQSGNVVFDFPVKENDKVIVFMEEYEDGTVTAHISDYARDTYIYYLGFLFILILLLIGKFRGFKTIITLLITMILIFKVLLPLILKGYNPIPITVLISTITTIISMFLIAGINKKSIASILGTLSGVIIAGALAFFVGTKVKLTGLSSEEANLLLFIPQNIDFNFKDLLFSGILLGALGAVMDVSMSIASSIDEINKVNNNLSRKDLFLSGMNVGKDIMGTMSNTLILAYTGSSIPLILIFMAYDTSFIRIMNLDIVATEIIRSLSGSIGLILTIPITAAISAFLLKDTTKDA